MGLKSFILVICMFSIIFGTIAQRSRMGKDSECYTANGRDYEGTQSTTYVKGDGSFEPTYPNIEDCLYWKDQALDFNVTDREKTLPLNYCRNPNNRLFPWCYVMRGGAPTHAYCHIPTCSTPALIGCFKLVVSGQLPPKGQNVTTTGPPPDLILDGELSLNGDENMKIARCLNFCRSKKYDYAGLTGGDTCMCGNEEDDGKQMDDVLNHLHPHDCLQYPCAADIMQACGGDNAIAIYDVEAGACSPPPIVNRDFGVIYSPRWPGNYAHELMCGWTIYVPDKFLTDAETRKKYQMSLSFSYFYLEKENDTVKFFTYANSTDVNSIMVAKHSGGETPAPVVLEIADVYAVHIVFNSDEDDKRDGFILHFNITLREGTTDTTTSTTTTTTISTSTTTTTTTTTTTVDTTPTPYRTTSSPSETSSTTTSVSPGTSSTLSTLAGISSSTTTTTVASSSTTNNVSIGASAKQSSGLDAGQIAGIVIGVAVMAVLLAVMTFLVLRFQKAKSSGDETVPRPPAMFNNPVTFNTEPNL